MNLKNGKYKAQILSNRTRCPDCNAGSELFVFIVTDDIRFKSVNRGGLAIPIYIRIGHYRNVMGINKAQTVESCKTLIRVCANCGHVRKMGIKT